MNYRTPGVYVEEISTLPASVAGVETAIPAFVGYTQITEYEDESVLFEPVRITSLLEYREMFGGPRLEKFIFSINDTYDEESRLISREFGTKLEGDTPSPFKLYYSLQLYFANGGGPCFIVSVGDYSGGEVKVGDAETGEGLLGGVRALEKADEPTLIVVPDAVSLDEVDEFGSIVKESLAQCNKLRDRFAIIDRYNSGTTVSDFRESLGMSYLNYGAVYYPFLNTTLNYQVDEDASEVNHLIHGTPPADSLDLTGGGTSYADLEDDHPNIYRSLQAEIKKVRVVLPPSAAIAGIYARVDRNRGVWKAPANVSVNSVIGPVEKLNDEMQEALNVDPDTGKSINVIRSFTGKGTLVWGARTLAGNDNEWRYVPVRRLFIYVEESIRKATEFVVFEPNTANTWVRVRAKIENFLTEIWRDGGLAGAAVEDAFFVKVGLGETMTSQDILEGRMIVEIGMAAVRPAEFIILRFMHKLQES